MSANSVAARAREGRLCLTMGVRLDKEVLHSQV